MSATAAIPRPATVEGRRVEAVEWPGAAARRPLVLLHEGLGSVGLWRDFPPALSAATGPRVPAFSLSAPGRGAPPPPRPTRGFFQEGALDALPAPLPQLDATDPILVGHS